ncbi:uncharacterized protein SEPMUDRAFT_151588 [Sphaerulina musiva SO2202]|uniref:Histone H4 n=1 Tax=Sphaerulina musiva (strain SO2202) TaxID=692275 RepID=N1QDP5_SPHMS|nr:uncharacterized protein SEPMUDRAFT_151588 [Sphaerulina musiva SO2202]EMF09636.1 hypothetical protein SEPMUDRAFT_151588 [Sphaerulina musiva SO2202]
MARFRPSNTSNTNDNNNNHNNAPTGATPLFQSDLPHLAASASSSGKARGGGTAAAGGEFPSTAGSAGAGAGVRRPGFATPGGGKQGFGGKTTTDAGGSWAGGRGLGVGMGPKRHRKVLRDNLQGVTKGDIRRLARRGGVKRIQATIYDETRLVLRKRLEALLKDICAVVELSDRKTVCVTDVVFVLNRMGRPLYGFGGAER